MAHKITRERSRTRRRLLWFKSKICPQIPACWRVTGSQGCHTHGGSISNESLAECTVRSWGLAGRGRPWGVTRRCICAPAPPHSLLPAAFCARHPSAVPLLPGSSQPGAETMSLDKPLQVMAAETLTETKEGRSCVSQEKWPENCPTL